MLDSKEVVSDMVKQAQEWMRENANSVLPPVAVLINGESKKFINIPAFDSWKEKKVIYTALAMIAKKLKADMVITINEARMATFDAETHTQEDVEEIAARGIADDPQYQECLIISVTGPGMNPQVICIKFDRDAENKPAFHEPDHLSITGDESSFNMMPRWWGEVAQKVS